jgi:CIC family chloride channel protein
LPSYLDPMRFPQSGDPHPPAHHEIGLSVSPALEAIADDAQVPRQTSTVDRRVWLLCAEAIVLAVVTGLVAQVLVALIGLITNIAFYGRLSFSEASPAPAVEQLGLWVISIPVIGALIVGVMARYGSRAIRGHGIPEAMEQVLTNESRIPARMTWLKPLSAAVSIGTGGPFGSEGPIIATGGAMGSLVGQLLRTTATERKTLLAAGAAAGMSAIFGTPVAAVLLAIELLLFEFRPRSIIPVALAAYTAAAVRLYFHGTEPAFQMPEIASPSGGALVFYILLGALMGLAATAVTRVTYGIEDAFERLPIHWMWWPAIGAVAVGVVGWIAPNTLGVGYSNISDLLSGNLTASAALFLCGMKFLSWSISLGSGTSGGTLAPLLTIGGAIGAAIGLALQDSLPGLGIDPRIAALVGMASLFTGASRATLASAVFMFEATLQPAGLLPLLGGCAAANLISTAVMTHSIMTEKIARRGVRTPSEYEADALDQVLVKTVATCPAVTVPAATSVGEIRAWIASGAAGSAHQGFPVVKDDGVLLAMVTRRDLANPAWRGEQPISAVLAQLPKYVHDDCTVRQAADHMVNHGIGRLPVLNRSKPPKVIGILTRSDVLSAFRHRVRQATPQSPTLRVRIPGMFLWKTGQKGRIKKTPT